MSKPDTPQYPNVDPAQVVTGQDATNQAMQLAQQYFGPQMGAQAQGLNDLSMGNAYYQQYQPTSFEQALGNQQFKNIWPDEQAQIMNRLSQSGMAYSPVAAQTEANAYGNLSTGIGEYLNNQANTRATNNLTSLLGFDPNNYYGPIANRITGQSNEQAGLNQQANMQNANAQYSNSLANYQQGNATNGAIGSALGGIGGFMVGGPGGAMIGSQLGGSLMGGSSAGGGMGNSLMASQYVGGMNNQPFGGMFNGQGQNGVNQNNYLNNAQSVYGGNVGSNFGKSAGEALPANPFG